MQPSMELRWFVQGGLHDDLSRWFENSRLVPNAVGEFTPSIDERDDTYLGLPYTAALGIKLRKGERIEIKERLLIVIGGARALTGHVEDSAHGGQGGAQLMGSIGGELALALKGRI